MNVKSRLSTRRCSVSTGAIGFPRSLRVTGRLVRALLAALDNIHRVHLPPEHRQSTRTIRTRSAAVMSEEVKGASNSEQSP